MRDPKRVSEVLKTVNPTTVGWYTALLCRDAAEIIDHFLVTKRVTKGDKG